MAQSKSNQFLVELGDVTLPEEISRKVDLAIRKAVLNVLAELDLRDEVIWKLHPEIRGIIADLSRQRIFR